MLGKTNLMIVVKCVEMVNICLIVLVLSYHRPSQSQDINIKLIQFLVLAKTEFLFYQPQFISSTVEQQRMKNFKYFEGMLMSTCLDNNEMITNFIFIRYFVLDATNIRVINVCLSYLWMMLNTVTGH